MVRKIAIFFLFSVFSFQPISGAERLWQAQNAGISDMDIRSVSLFSGDGNFICATSLKGVYFSQNRGESWEEIFSLKPGTGEINFVTFDCSSAETLFLATTEGLFTTKSQGKAWQRIFRRVSEEAKDVGWIALDCLDCRKIYIGTKEGLYFSQDKGASWSKLRGGLRRCEVRSIALHPSNSRVLYLANTYGLFKSIDSGRAWERIYVTSYKLTNEENGEEEETEEESTQINENQNLINCIAIDKRNPKQIFIATGVGIFVSHDAGEAWNKLPGRGLISDYVNFIVLSPDKEGVAYAATKNGVFEFFPKLNSWQEIYQGMTARDVRSLALDIGGRQLFAGTDKGVFKTIEVENARKQRQQQEEKVEIDEEEKVDFKQILKEFSLNEPSIRQVQEAALRYAEVVHPDKIKAMRRNAKLKALLPDVSLDYDKTVSISTNPDYKESVVGPRDWGLTLSWDVGDLVFNSQVRLIDGQARLMVQTRDDILNEVTRLYYERRKLQTEFILSPPEEPEDKLTKALRLEELTANIDALTGGYFSGHKK